MSHEIRVLIAHEETALIMARHLLDAHVVRLPQGFALIPWTDELDPNFEAMPAELLATYRENPEHFLGALAEAISKNGPIALITTSYFGGIGTQSATVYAKGRVVLSYYEDSEVYRISKKRQDNSTEGAINSALRRMGVERDKNDDEFDTMHLGWHRNTEEWLEEESLLDKPTEP